MLDDRILHIVAVSCVALYFVVHYRVVSSRVLGVYVLCCVVLHFVVVVKSVPWLGWYLMKHSASRALFYLDFSPTT